MAGADLLDAPGGPTVWRRRRCWTIDEHTSNLSHATPKTRRSFDNHPSNRILPEREN